MFSGKWEFHNIWCLSRPTENSHIVVVCRYLTKQVASCTHTKRRTSEYSDSHITKAPCVSPHICYARAWSRLRAVSERYTHDLTLSLSLVASRCRCCFCGTTRHRRPAITADTTRAHRSKGDARPLAAGQSAQPQPKSAGNPPRFVSVTRVTDIGWM